MGLQFRVTRILMLFLKTDNVARIKKSPATAATSITSPALVALTPRNDMMDKHELHHDGHLGTTSPAEDLNHLQHHLPAPHHHLDL